MDDGGGKIAYLVITPDPKKPDSFSTVAGAQGFYLKFGDAKTVDFVKRYSTHTPGHGVSWNVHCLYPKFEMTFIHVDPVTKEKKYDVRPVRVGKTLEHIYMTDYCEGGPNASEWWWITPNLNISDEHTIHDLREELHQLLLQFPNHDYWPLDQNIETASSGVDTSPFSKMMKALPTRNNVYATAPRPTEFTVMPYTVQLHSHP